MFIGLSVESDVCILNGEIDIIYVFLEWVINDVGWREGIIKLKVCFIVIDEFYIIVIWLLYFRFL